jgi:uncharacterized protein YkwD
MVRAVVCLPVLALVLAVSPLAADDLKPAAESKKENAFRMTDDEKQLLEMTNAERAKKDLPPLKANPTLFKVARLHSANMAKQGQMTHFLDGKSPAQRATAGGYDWSRVAENVANSDGAPLKDIMEGWMNSKIHRENILRTGLEEIGLGIARNDKGEVYYTQLFATPRRKQ